MKKKYVITHQRGSFTVSRTHVTTSECCTLFHLHIFSAPDSSEVCRLSSYLATVGSCCKAANCPTANDKVWQWADEESLSREMHIFEVGGQTPKRWRVRRGSVGQGDVSGWMLNPLRLCWIGSEEIVCQCWHNSYMLLFSHALSKKSINPDY